MSATALEGFCRTHENLVEICGCRPIPNGRRDPTVDDQPPWPEEPPGDHPADRPFHHLGTPLTRSELAALPKVRQLVDGVLSYPCAAVVVGGYGLGKSVLVHGLACSVGTGRPWLGREVARHRALIVVGEGAYGLDERFRAWEQAWNGGKAIGPDEVTFLIKPASLRNEVTWQEITAYATAGGYGFVILDTFSSLASDADETKDAALIMRRISDLSEAIDGTVLLVHHPGWSDAGRTRGGYQFEANADEVLVMTAVSEGSSLVCLTRKKVKDGASGSTIWINRKAAFGSVIFEHARANDAEVPMRNRILTVLGNYGDLGATGPQLKDELAVPDGSRSAFYKALNKLSDGGEIRAEGARQKARYYLASVPKVDSPGGLHRPDVDSPDPSESTTSPPVRTPSTRRRRAESTASPLHRNDG